MRNQYQLLAEKYNLVKDAAIDPFENSHFTQTAQVVIQVMVHIKNIWTEFINKEASGINLNQELKDRIWNNFITNKIPHLNNYLASTTQDSSKSFAGVVLRELPENHIAAYVTITRDANKVPDENNMDGAIFLNVDYLSQVAFTKTPEEQKKIINRITNSLYHEYIHFIQYQKHLARNPQSLISKLKSMGSQTSLSNAEYYNTKNEIMTQASDAANFFFRKFGNAEDAIKALIRLGDRYTKEMELTPENKKRFYRYTIDYINILDNS